MALYDSSKNRTITDTMQLLFPILCGVFCLIFFALPLTVGLFTNSSTLRNLLIFLILDAVAIAFIVKCWLTIQARKGGFVIDAETGILTYPGGGRSATAFKDFVTAEYWLQSLRRYELNIAEITEIDAESFSLAMKLSHPIMLVRCNHFITVKGAFGEVELSLWSEKKFDELTSLLLEMSGLENKE